MIRRAVPVIADIEAALVAHWAQFARWPRGELQDEHGLLRLETPISHLPYNGVIRTRLREAADARIAAALERFRARGVPCFWFAHPTATTADLEDRLLAHGLEHAASISCMSLELAAWRPPPMPAHVQVEEVLDDRALQIYTDLTMHYWQIRDDQQPLVVELQRHLAPGKVPGHRYLARCGGAVVGKGYLSLAGPPGVAAIYGMSVLPHARGRGVAGALTTALLQRARASGCHRAVLHSTAMAVGVYRRAGFVERCELALLASAAAWPDH
jgi:GNAT superfamily N-acetyltransferase